MTEFQSVVFYITLFTISTLFVYLSSKRRLPWQARSLFAVLGVIIPTLLSGLRGQSVGTDTPEYIKMYSEILSGSFDVPIEPMTTLVAHMSGFITSSPWLFFSVFALISTLFYYLALAKVSKDYMWYMWFLYLFIYFTFSFNIMRQMAAVSVLFYAITWLVVSENKKFFIAWSFMAACIHAVSIIPAALFYVFYKMDNRKNLSRAKVVVITIGLAGVLGALASNFERVVSFIPLPIFQKVLDNANRGEASLDIANGLFYLLVTLMMIIAYSRIRRVFSGMTVFAMGLAIGSVLIFLDSYMAHAGRLAYFFVVPALPVTLYAILLQVRDARWIVALATMLMAVALFVITRYLGEGSDIIPYMTFSVLSSSGGVS